MKKLYLIIIICLISQRSVFSQQTGYIELYSPVNLTENKTIRRFTKTSLRDYRDQSTLLTFINSDAKDYFNLYLYAGKQVRIEFDQLLDVFRFTSVQSRINFIRSPALVNMNLMQLGQFVRRYAQAVQSIYTRNNLKNVGELQTSFVSYQASNLPNEKVTKMAHSTQVRNFQCIDYKRISRQLFVATFKNQDNSIGPLGVESIHVINAEKLDAKRFIDKSALGTPAAPVDYICDFSKAESVFTRDSLMFSFVSKLGMVGLDVSADGRQLWIASLSDRKLYKINLPATGQIPTVADIASYTVPCIGHLGTTGPFAVKLYGGKVYLGVISNATGEKATVADLRTTVLAFDPTHEKFEIVFSIALDYSRDMPDCGLSG